MKLEKFERTITQMVTSFKRSHNVAKNSISNIGTFTEENDIQRIGVKNASNDTKKFQLIQIKNALYPRPEVNHPINVHQPGSIGF